MYYAAAEKVKRKVKKVNLYSALLRPVSKALRYGPCVTRRSHSFTCHSHKNHTCLYFPAARHHRSLVGTNLYCLVNRGTQVWETCPVFLRSVPGRDSNPRPLDRKSDTLPIAPRRHQTMTWEKFYTLLLQLHVRQQSGMITWHAWGSMTGKNCTPAETT